MEKDKKLSQRISQFDDIPEKSPVVFISYSWDNESHKEWVKKFADDLRNNNIYSLLDQYLQGGEDLNFFMSEGIKKADEVLIIGTPQYKSKIENMDYKSGVYIEGRIFLNDLFLTQRKFIPILRKGIFKTSFSDEVTSRKGYDFTDNSKYDEQFKKLVGDLTNQTRLSKLEISTSVSKEASRINLQEQVNTNVLKAYKDEKFLKDLLDYFSFNLMDGYLKSMPKQFDIGMDDSYYMWCLIMSKTTFIIRDSQLNKLIKAFFIKWQEIIKLGNGYYDSDDMKTVHFFPLKNDLIIDPQADKVFNEIKCKLPSLKKSYYDFADYLKANYPLLDLEDLSEKFEEKDNS